MESQRFTLALSLSLLLGCGGGADATGGASSGVTPVAPGALRGIAVGRLADGVVVGTAEDGRIKLVLHQAGTAPTAIGEISIPGKLPATISPSFNVNIAGRQVTLGIKAQLEMRARSKTKFRIVGQASVAGRSTALAIESLDFEALPLSLPSSGQAPPDQPRFVVRGNDAALLAFAAGAEGFGAVGRGIPVGPGIPGIPVGPGIPGFQTPSGSTTVYLSADQGGSWRQLAMLPGDPLDHVFHDGRHWLATSLGWFVSADAVAWTPALEHAVSDSLDIAATLTGDSWGAFYDCPAQRGFITSDAGETWTELAPVPGVGGASCVGGNQGARGYEVKLQILDDGTVFLMLPGLGWIARSLDQGRTWEAVPESRQQLAHFRFVDRDHGWAVGNQILHTDDGGKTWLAGASAQGGQARDIIAISNTEAWVIWPGGALLRARLVGNSITLEPQPVGECRVAWSMIAWSALDMGILCSDNAQAIRLYVTSNGGEGWTAAQGISAHAERFAVFPSGKGLYFGEDGLQTSSDGGRTWSAPQGRVSRGTYYQATSPDSWIEVSGSGLTFTRDGGRTINLWAPALNTGRSQAMRAFHASGDTLLARLSTSPVWLSTTSDGARWSLMQGWFEDVALAGMSGIGIQTREPTLEPTLYATSDGGGSWQVVPGAPARPSICTAAARSWVAGQTCEFPSNAKDKCGALFSITAGKLESLAEHESALEIAACDPDQAVLRTPSGDLLQAHAGGVDTLVAPMLGPGGGGPPVSLLSRASEVRATAAGWTAVAEAPGTFGPDAGTYLLRYLSDTEYPDFSGAAVVAAGSPAPLGPKGSRCFCTCTCMNCVVTSEGDPAPANATCADTCPAACASGGMSLNCGHWQGSAQGRCVPE